MDKKTIVLGVSCFYHDSAAALVIDGDIIAAAQEERFTRKKHDPRFPRNAINYCLEEGRVENNEIDAVVFYDNPLLSFDRIIKSLKKGFPESIIQWQSLAPSLLSHKLFIEERIKKHFLRNIPVLYCEHHFAHAASAFYPSPYNEAAFLTVDGVGEWATTSLGYAEENDMHILREINYPHSLGLLYSAFTNYCGFKVNSGEYKLMGLAPYGEPVYKDLIYEHLIDVKPDGSYKLNMEYFGFINSMNMINSNFERLFGGAARKSESKITRREMNIAASIQKVTEEIIIRLSTTLKNITNKRNLVLAGGVALNCVANGILLREKIFDNVWVQPASGDAGGALGAALMATHNYFGKKRISRNNRDDFQKGSYLGIKFSNDEVQSFLNTYNVPAHRVEKNARAKEIAKLLSEQKVIGYFAGRMEYGPRALGARSIIGDPRNPKMQRLMNLKIKFRESFRPFAPAVLKEKVSEYFETDNNTESPYMLFVSQVKKNLCKPDEQSNNTENMIEIVNRERSTIPAVTHVDYSARIQTVDKRTNPKFYDIIREFEALTGCAVVINTSFNVRGEPIVCTPKDAYVCFMRTNMDILVIEDYIFYKEEQPAYKDTELWETQYELD